MLGRQTLVASATSPDRSSRPHLLETNSEIHSSCGGSLLPQWAITYGCPSSNSTQVELNGYPISSYSGSVQIGGYFQERHRELAREYYERPENHGFCPPGLAKKGNGCMPPGQAKKWRQGYPLSASLVYYEVPRSVVMTLGVPPSGYRYVRVASDILLIAIGTNMVVDAIQDLVH